MSQTYLTRVVAASALVVGVLFDATAPTIVDARVKGGPAATVDAKVKDGPAEGLPF